MFKRFKKWIIGFFIGSAVLAGGYGYLGADKIEVLDTVKIQEKYNQSIKIKEKYNIQGTELITKIEHIDDIKIKIGEIGEFKPNAEISRWDGEVKMKVKPRLNSKSKKKKLDFENKKIKYKEDKKEYHLYEVKKGDETYNGATSTIDAYEVEVILLEKPDSNIVEFDIETQGLNFYYQPELTQKEKDEGAFRPENVVGSYAVYHESKQGDYSKMGLKNYQAGKAFHIYRPKIIDSAGTEVWGKLNITDNLLTVEIPQEFLDNAVYPVRHAAGLTFGENNTGASEKNINIDDIYCYWATPTDGDGDIDSIHFYMYRSYDRAGETQHMKGIVINQSDKNIIVNGISPQSSWEAGFTKSWNVINYSSKPSIVNNTTYGICAISENYNNEIDYDSGASGWTDTTNSFSSPIDPTDGNSGNTYIFSIYCTYQASGGDARRIITTQ